jgi:hypothetical protein
MRRTGGFLGFLGQMFPPKQHKLLIKLCQFPLKLSLPLVQTF